MKKSIIFGGSILCLFILVSLSYQPIIAEKPIIENTKLKKKSFYDFDIERYKELFYRFVNNELSFQDCDCNSKIIDEYPVITCYILAVINIISLIISYGLFELGFYGYIFIYFAQIWCKTWDLGRSLDCPWIPDWP